MMLPRGPAFGLTAVLLLSACANSNLDPPGRRNAPRTTARKPMPTA